MNENLISRIKNKSLFLILAPFALASCSSDIENIIELEIPETLPQEIVVDGNISLGETEQKVIGLTNDFGFDILEQISINDPGNSICFSPLSLLNTLALSANGTSEDTRDFLLSIFNIEGNNHEKLEILNKTCKELIFKLPLVDESVNYLLTNSFWSANKNINPDFFNVLDMNYKGSFINESPSGTEGLEKINDWVSDKTNGHLTDFLKEPVESEVALLNTVYFNGEWQTKFLKENTRKKKFTNFDGSTVDIDFMLSNQEESLIGRNESWLSFTLPFGAGNFSMTFVTNTGSSPLPVLKEEQWKALIDKTHEQDAMVDVPKFDITYGNNLYNIIENYKPGSLSKSNFTEFFIDHSVYKLNTILHKTRIAINENGGEMSSGTYEGYDSGLPTRIYFNKPFYFIIHEKTSGAILFLGKIMKF